MAVAYTPTSDEDEWEREIRIAERAVRQLLAAKRKTLNENPVQEQVLWSRHRQRLQDLKRKLDAAVM